MIPLVPVSLSAMSPQALPQPGGAARGSEPSGLEFAGLLEAALPSETSGLRASAPQSPPAGPAQTASVPAVPAPSPPPAFLPDLLPELQTRPQPLSEPRAAPLPSPGGTLLPPSGAIVPEVALAEPAMLALPQPTVAPQQALPAMEAPRELRLVADGDEPVDIAGPTARLEDLQPKAPVQAALTASMLPEGEAVLPDPPQAPPAPLAPTQLLPLTVGEAAPPASSHEAMAAIPQVDEASPEAAPPVPVSPPPPAPALPLPLGAAKRSGSVTELPDAVPAPSPQLALEPPAVVRADVSSAPWQPSVSGTDPAPRSRLVPVAANKVLPSQPALLAAGPVPAPLAQQPEPPATEPLMGVTGPLTSETDPTLAAPPSAPTARFVAPARAAARPEPLSAPSHGASEPAVLPFAAPASAPSPDAAPPPPSIAASPVQAPASPPPSALPAAPVITAAPEPSASPEPARAAPSPQLEETITAVGDLREAYRSARPEMTVRHAEFGAVSLRLEAAGAQDWRVVLASRDPGFVPAIQAALAERAVAAAAETSLAGGGSQSGSGEPRYGSSLGSGQGGSQPYSGQSHSRDEGGLAHHQQQRQQRGSGTSAAADAGPQPGDGTPRERGLFA